MRLGFIGSYAWAHICDVTPCCTVTFISNPIPSNLICSPLHLHLHLSPSLPLSPSNAMKATQSTLPHSTEKLPSNTTKSTHTNIISVTSTYDTQRLIHFIFDSPLSLPLCPPLPLLPLHSCFHPLENCEKM